MILQKLKVKIPLYEKFLILMMFLYICSGNLLRLGRFSELGGFPIFELFFYVFGLSFYFFRKFILPKKIFLIILIFFVSWILGILRFYGETEKTNILLALSYTLRIINMLLVSNVFGFIFCYYLNKKDIKKLYLLLFLLQIFLSIVFFALFPDATEMWKFLAQYGIVFYGDPHIKRLIGPPLDPNFFGNLLVMPTILSLSMLITERPKNKLLLMLFIIYLTSLLLTISRSSLFGLIVSITIIIFTIKKPSKVLTSLVLIALSLLLIGIFSSDLYNNLIKRFSNIYEDPSAHHRLNSFLGGLSYLKDPYNLIIGIGYNYIPFVVDRRYIVTGFDSSILNFILSLGIPLFFTISALTLKWCNSCLRGLKNLDFSIFTCCRAYLISSVFMSMFNHLLAYPLYLATILPLLFCGFWNSKVKYGYFSLKRANFKTPIFYKTRVSEHQ